MVLFLSLAKKITDKFGGFRRSPITDRFIKHNEKLFLLNSGKKNVVLFELNAMQSSHIAYSYLANVLAKESDAQLIAYEPFPRSTIVSWVLFQLKKLFGSEFHRVYRSFGAAEIFAIRISHVQKRKAHKLFTEIFELLQNKRDIENIAIHGAGIGDLVYDSYLKSFNKPTIEKNDREFKDFLLKSIELFLFWEEYFENNNVCAVNVSHCVYNLAMPLRLAVERNIPAFQSNITHIYRLSKSNYFAYNDFLYFPEQFASLPEKVKEAGITEAKRRIQRRFLGEVGVDMKYSNKSAYGESSHARLLRDSSRKKILIATHCFFDSPHSYGNNLFPDFYEWLDFLGKMTEVTNYDWYIKTHPDYLPGTMEIVLGFISRYPKFTLLPADASHHQIIGEGIDVALTTYGTIGFEYAALGVPVINASLCNPHIAYDFNIHAKDVEDYRRLLLSLETLEFEIDKKQVYEYYFMRYIYNTENMFFDSYQSTIGRLGGYNAQFGPELYEQWLDEWTPEKHKSILAAIHEFIISNDFRMNCKYLERDFHCQEIRS